MKKITLGLSAFALATAGTALAAGHEGRMGPDANDDGVVTRAEAQAHAGKMFAKMDANNDGALNEADREARKAERKTKMFEALDADSNGQISRDEFMAFEHEGKRGKRGKHHRMGHGRDHHGKMMKGADTNNDGAISEAEFTTAALARFDKTDTNNDGQVTREERRAAFKEMRGKWHGKARDKSET